LRGKRKSKNRHWGKIENRVKKKEKRSYRNIFGGETDRKKKNGLFSRNQKSRPKDAGEKKQKEIGGPLTWGKDMCQKRRRKTKRGNETKGKK